MDSKVKEDQKIINFLLSSKVFFVGSKIDKTVLIAIKPYYQHIYRTIYWWDTNKERSKIIAKVISSGEKGEFYFLDAQNIDYRFLPMTLDIYNKFVKARLFNGKDFKTINELSDFFEKNIYL